MLHKFKVLRLMSMLVFSMLLFFYPFMLSAQVVNPVRSHPINLADQPVRNFQSSDTLTIIAVRVEFQQDDNSLTSGNGTFSNDGLPFLTRNNISIDPLPHNQAYFESHLKFVKNYFEEVSGGELNIVFNVLPNVYQLQEMMSFYSPTGETFSTTPLARLAQDTWQTVEAQGGFDTSTLDPERTAFIIFHAGVGRDIELTGTTLDITPQDIPSISLSQNSIASLLNEPNFQGFPINNGSFRITNSLILPQTLSRRGEDVAGNELVLQLSINGLVTASVGSYLGLPDLFNTQTGESGIGRFGLMDGESFFSYRGLFPPEPSAWEKTFLGWQDTFSIPLNDTQVSLPAASLHQPNSIGRHSISSKEYFLVENRHRDPLLDDLTITIQKNDGSTIQQTFTNNDQVFTNQQAGFEELLEAGVLIDTDNFDWSLPGGLDLGDDGEADTPDDRFLNGGILIWHIDEAVIDNQINQQAVNANPMRRGVDVEEADGAQDIGQAATADFSLQARGTAFDFWWSGNNARVITQQGDTLQLYENRFSDTTTPNNKSNSGAPTFFEFDDFSDNLPTASFRAKRVSNTGISSVTLPRDSVPGSSTFVAPNQTYLNNYPPALSFYVSQADSFLIIPANNSVFALQITNSTTPLFDFQQASPQQPYIGTGVILADDPENTSTIDLTRWLWDGSNWVQSWQATTPPNRGFLSSLTGTNLFIDFTDTRLLTANGTALPNLPSPRQSSSTLLGNSSVLTSGQLTLNPSNNSLATNTDLPRVYTGAFQLSNTDPGFYIFTETSWVLIDPARGDAIIPIIENTRIDWPALVDFNDDGRTDILYTDLQKNMLNAKNQSGATLDFFPIPAPEGTRFTGTPLVADIEGDGLIDLFVLAQDSLSINLYAFDNQARIKEGFPLFIGTTESIQHRPIEPLIVGNTLYALSHAGDIKAWQFSNLTNVRWGSKYGNEPFNKVTGRVPGNNTSVPISSILSKKETYNWPNPASEQTRIRYQVQGPGSVQIKIITPGGRVIYEEEFETFSGLPEEQIINTSDWGSGIYLAMVTATVQGQQERKLIKMAIVH